MKKQDKKKSWISKLGTFDRYNLSFFLTSIIPLAILAYVVVAVVSPALVQAKADDTLMWLQILVFFLIFLAVLGFFVQRSATRETFDTLSEYNDRLQYLFDISQALSRQIHLDVLLQDIVKSAIEMTGASGGIVLLKDIERNVLTFDVSIGVGAITVKEVPLGKGLAGWVAQNGEMAMVNNLQTDNRYNEAFNILPNFHTSAILAAPLGTGSKSFGALELLHRREDNREFTDEDASILKSLAGQASVFIENARFRDDQQNYFFHITEILLSALEGTRQFWNNHLKNTSRYSYLIGKMMNLSDSELRILHYAALLHDLGFIKINLKEGHARKMIELHPELGYEMIKPIALWKEVAPLVRYHHEWFDGTGYPHKIKGVEIPLGSRIIAVAETFDVLTNPASYKQETITNVEALKVIQKGVETQFDPKIVNALAKLVKEKLV